MTMARSLHDLRDRWAGHTFDRARRSMGLDLYLPEPGARFAGLRPVVIRTLTRNRSPPVDGDP